jgi:hypothetical protein
MELVELFLIQKQINMFVHIDDDDNNSNDNHSMMMESARDGKIFIID